ncbi:MAG: hypothetical protein ABIQ61_02155 [Ornithinibacter sp.]
MLCRTQAAAGADEADALAVGLGARVATEGEGEGEGEGRVADGVGMATGELPPEHPAAASTTSETGVSTTRPHEGRRGEAFVTPARYVTPRVGGHGGCWAVTSGHDAG